MSGWSHNLLGIIYSLLWGPSSIFLNEKFIHNNKLINLDIVYSYTAKLICVFVFAYADCWFSHGAAHLFDTLFSATKLARLINFNFCFISESLNLAI